MQRIFFVLYMIVGITSCSRDEGEKYLRDVYFADHSEVLGVGRTEQLRVMFYPEGANAGVPDEPKRWLSSDSTIVSVDATGTISGVSPGIATVTMWLGTFKAVTEIYVDEVYQFSDSLFLDYCLAEFDENGDGELQGLEVFDVEGLDVTDLARYEVWVSFKGIEKFKSLKKLNVSGIYISELDLSHNVELKDLDCSLARIQTLDLTNNGKLEMLDCHGCVNLKTLDLGTYDKHGVNNINVINCFGCALDTLDLSRCEMLEYLDCRDNKLKGLDVSRSPLLTQLSCCGNEIGEITFADDFDMDQLKTYDR
jgi:hypothetical protein